MCPMVWLSIMTTLILLIIEMVGAFHVTFSVNKITLPEKSKKLVQYTLTDFLDNYTYNTSIMYKFQSDNDEIASVEPKYRLCESWKQEYHNNCDLFDQEIEITANFIGSTHIRVIKEIVDDNSTSDITIYQANSPSPVSNVNNGVEVVVVIEKNVVRQIFLVSVIILVNLNYINMGCVLDLDVVKSVIKKPVAPLIGLCSQYLFMPLIAYLIGYLILDTTYFRFALLAFGCSPGGSASNMWTLLLGGNLDLSLTMTFVSTALALAMMPLWLFTLGSSILGGATASIPYMNTISALGGMGLCLCIGIAMQRYLPKVAAFCKKILVPVSVFMIIFIVIFGTYAYSFMFKLFSWRILSSAGCCVWFGFLFGYVVAKICRQSSDNVIAIAVETGIQQTGTTIAVLLFTLPQPFNDLSTAVPIAASLLTPIPLALVWFYRTLKRCMTTHKKYDPTGDMLNSNTTDAPDSNCKLIKGTSRSPDAEKNGNKMRLG